MQFVIIHGTFGSRDGNWFPWLDRELTALGQQVIRPQMPVDRLEEVEKALKSTGIYTNAKQTLNSWLATFEKDVVPLLAQDDLVLVGHSLAPAFLLRAVETFQLSVDCAIFVAPFIQDLNNPLFDVINHDFYKNAFNFRKITEKLTQSYSLYSPNDPYVSASAAQFFAKKVNSTRIEVRSAGHMGSVFSQFPLVLELCKTRIGFGK